MHRKNIGIVTFLSLWLLLASASVNAAPDWELQQLHQPSEHLLELEQAGRITIYDGVPVADVEQALDKQFDRIDTMMFIRTLHPTPSGYFEADDDCD